MKVALDYAKDNPGLGLIVVGLLLLAKLYRYSSISKYNFHIRDILNHPIDLLEICLIVWFIGWGTWVFLS